ncbi:hypothetical protein BACI71_30987 [Bacillus mycoides]|uniref:Uncharacterized protein n=1 Tax=Bacillus mycoides TaxID=1405 RepID=A0A653YVI9_BACMY|nr:hypothetical protein BACI71_30987 [Bacillus mycoides]
MADKKDVINEKEFIENETYKKIRNNNDRNNNCNGDFFVTC